MTVLAGLRDRIAPRGRSRNPWFDVDPTERRSAVLLLVGTGLALLWSNLPQGGGYTAFWETSLKIAFGDASIDMTLREGVNDGLMTLFFFVVGLEVKSEIRVGELRSPRRAVIPMVAAVLGVAVPALIFVVVNAGRPNAGAWGVVISTDTAFLVGALALVGPRLGQRLRVFLLTLAVVDDIGALLVIAVVYSAGVQVVPLLVAVVLLALQFLVRYLRTGRGPATLVVGIASWVALHFAGVHPTIAGVVLALVIPAYSPRPRSVQRLAEVVRAFQQSPNSDYAVRTRDTLRASISPNERLQAAFGPYVSYLILPVFALANAGVRLDGAVVAEALRSPLFWGIIAGLALGKPLGVAGGTLLMRRTGLGTLAPGLSMGRIVGGGLLSGIGFTISLFIVELAIPQQRDAEIARFGVLVASTLAFVLGTVWFRVLDRVQPPDPVLIKLLRPFDPARDHFDGPADAPSVLVEYGDFECPFCSRATAAIDEVRAHYGDRLVHVWRHLPLPDVHPHALAAAHASEAVALQTDGADDGRYHDFTRLLFAHQDALEQQDVEGYVREVGLDVERFRADVMSREVARRVQEDVDDTVEMDLHSTPTFFIDGKRRSGAYDAQSLIEAIDASRRLHAERDAARAGAGGADVRSGEPQAAADPQPVRR